jgi:hypothetical protein
MPRVFLNLHGRTGVVPEAAVYIGEHHGPRRLRRANWYNPYKIDKYGRVSDGTREEVVAKDGRHLYDSGLINDIHELRAAKTSHVGALPSTATCCCGSGLDQIFVLANQAAHSQRDAGCPSARSTFRITFPRVTNL